MLFWPLGPGERGGSGVAYRPTVGEGGGSGERGAMIPSDVSLREGFWRMRGMKSKVRLENIDRKRETRVWDNGSDGEVSGSADGKGGKWSELI
jgi:hypothetical protein